ncbi:hypothetical protein IEQ34_021882 [Dendrobium chrysotoxum]|uniref:Uncharacterized protein n=1 Tax=Dendrobium chrysotoxum TaxID=161865 RepID=A0AAV7FXB7_DENCH|nr:hypothetical protein IEQ34_021882 [Dendrobium chrysotoxum]
MAPKLQASKKGASSSYGRRGIVFAEDEEQYTQLFDFEVRGKALKREKRIYDHHYSREMNDQLRLKNGLLHIEKILDSMSYPDERKVSLAIILLDGEA